LKCEARGEITKSKPKPPSPEPTQVPPVAKESSESVRPAKTQGPDPSPSRSHARIIIALLIVILLAELLGVTSTKSAATRWEYTIESPSDSVFRTRLAELGGAGWELIFARRATSDFEGPSYEMIFKRPR
jgi:hypothetical protein